MLGAILKRLRQLRGNKPLLFACAVGFVLLLIITAFVLGQVSQHHDSTSATLADHTRHVATDTNASKDAASKTSSTQSGSKSASSPTAPKSSTTNVVVKTTANSDGTTTKEIASYVTLPYSSQTQNEVNLKRGVTQVQPAGQNGIEKIVYSVTYDASGKEISRKTLSDTVTSQVVNQITRIGISDFNLNSDTWDGAGFGETCLQADFGTAGDGCIGTPSDQSMSMITISGVNYAHCVSSTSGACKYDNLTNIQPVIAIAGDNTFTYQGSVHVADIRAGVGGGALLTASDCASYGLACGSW